MAQIDKVCLDCHGFQEIIIEKSSSLSSANSIDENENQTESEMLADVYETQGPNEVSRENGLRRIVISANVSNRDLASVVRDIKSKIHENLELPKDYFVTYGGQFEAQESAI